MIQFGLLLHQATKLFSSSECQAAWLNNISSVCSSTSQLTNSGLSETEFYDASSGRFLYPFELRNQSREVWLSGFLSLQDIIVYPVSARCSICEDAYAAARKAGRYKQIKHSKGVSSTDAVGGMQFDNQSQPCIK
ncbi:unnamed protein product [Vicia faba]|uniref:Uncharacterized protein n=1 Tax=Vicia faba TaxID=3906 RepID=A0AAV0YII4_VICFA|nr:unnamed protein product [Vicia faba]